MMSQAGLDRILKSVIVAVTAAVLLAAVPAQSAEKTCYSCHKEAEAKFKKKVQHVPVAKQDCESCHIRHGFSNMLILKSEGKELCTTCHTDFDSLVAKGQHVHPAVAEGLCATCHDPHASDSPGLMRQVDGDLACFVCHSQMLDSTGTAKQHAPFAQRDCQRCHENHSSNQNNLLIKEESLLCADCHTADKTQKSHGAKGLTTAGLGCSGCHDPHLSKRAGLLSATVHEPVASGMCDACHTGAPIPPSTIGAADSTWEGCSACHDAIAEKINLATPHAPAAMGHCYECHTAHKSNRPNLLKAGAAELCQNCHDDMSAETLAKSASVHQPVRDGQCASCHDPHGSTEASLLVKSGDALCQSCHSTEKFTQSHHLQAAGVACLDCHQPHASGLHALLKDDPRVLCANCHEPDLTPTMVAHEPVKQGDCALCHDPHGGPGTMLQRPTPGLCFECHQNIARFASASHKHEAAEDCATCHGSHEAPQKSLLLKSGADLCSDCHDVSKEPASKSVHAPFARGDCAGCHNPHGSDRPALLGPRRQMVSTPVGPIFTYPKIDSTSVSLCKTCHAEDIETWKGRTVQHLPAFNGECSACHAPHQSVNGNLLVKPTGQLCQGCHDPASIPLEPHHGINLASADCGQCHDPHASNKKGLLKAQAHEPFADGDCETCHTGPGSVTLSEPQPGLCLTCHEDMEAAMALPVAHAPVAGGECTECHSPHASNETSLLVAKPAALCTECHEQTPGQYRHDPYVAGECLDCHLPHGSDNPALLVKSTNATCLGCHSALEERLSKERPHAALEKGCLVCHDGHASNTPSLLKSPPSTLCATCHDTKTEHWRSIHVVPGTDGSGGDCMSCHDPHASPPNTNAMLKRSQHPPFEARECTSCHESQGATPNGARALCVTCHESTVSGIDKMTVVHAPVAEGSACLTCHSPHVGDTPALLKKTGFSVCTDCHKTINLSAPFVHAPAREDCAICHTPHGGDNAGLLVDSDPMSLCTGCHEDATKTHFHPMGDQTKKPENRGLIVCTSCHSPHNSEQKALLLGDPSRGLCVRCHDPSGHMGG